MPETTALGAAMAAGAAVGIWDLDAESAVTTDTFTPMVSAQERDRRYETWKEAVKRSMGWEKHTDKCE